MKKVLKGILLTLLVLCGIALIVIYIIFPNETKANISYVWGLLNTPLPIVGISIVAILVFVWQFFSHSQYGKKRINELQNKIEELKQEKQDFVFGANEKIEELENYNAELKGYLSHICELSTNIKIKNYGKELLSYGKETIDSETKAD